MSERQNQEPHCKPKASKEQIRNRHKKKLAAKEKFKMNINKQEPETKKKVWAWLQSRYERILYSTTLHAKGNITIVATRGTSGFSYAIGIVIFSVLGWCNIFLCVKMAANCHATGFGKNSKQNKRSSFRL